MKILFQGDSITDAGRNRADFHNLGNGYPKYAAQNLCKMHPDVDFEFVNLGISGDETVQLVDRLQTDFIDIQPDIVSILVGINDVWHHTDAFVDHAVFEKNYREILQEIKDKTSAKIVMIEPFLIPVEDKLFFREDLSPKIEVIRRLAREFADVYIPLDGLLVAEYLKKNPTYYASDGVHPTALGAEVIGKIYAKAVSCLVTG